MASIGAHLGLMAAFDFGIQVAVWSVSAVFQTERFYDLTGSSTYVLLAIYSLYVTSGGLEWPPLHAPRKALITVVVLCWALRLGSFLFYRIMRDGKDVRFDRVKTKPLRFLIYWLIQGVWVFIMMLPVFLTHLLPDDATLTNLDVAGAAVWFLGWAAETVADLQKLQFRSVAANKGKFITHGLWSISRHPNYAGEVVAWFGVFLIGIGGTGPVSVHAAACVLSPVFIYFLLTRVSGVPLLERAGKKKWGEDAAYQAYIKRTPCMFPLFG